MTSPLGSTSAVKDTVKSKFNKRKHRNRHSFHFIAKHLANKQHCNKALKRKLKKYKLRHDGQEDQDILDVSEILISSLTLKSPRIPDCEDHLTDDWRPKNYLFKMIRKRKVESSIENIIGVETKQNTNISNGCNDVIDGDAASSTLCDSQEKKHMNAFKLLMDSRSKSIGTNSPGKEKPDDQIENNTNDSKSVKVKRQILLQKMAEAKGSLKKKEFEEIQEECIKRKLKRRAQNFKKMLLHQETKVPTKQESKKNVDSPRPPSSTDVTNKVEETSGGKSDRALQIINIFEDSDIEADLSKTNKKTLSRDDEDFLKKLSPSIKKKENMLCYFKKVEKECVSLVESESENVVIKVKLATKSKKKIKKKKGSLKELGPADCIKPELESIQDTLTINNQESDKLDINSTFVENKSKRKRNFKEITSPNQKLNQNMIVTNSEERPKRNIKKPVKYIDDLFPSSSDEELQILTPKKKKRSEANNNTDLTSKDKTADKTVQKLKSKDTEKQKKIEVKKDVQLAPIFNTKRLSNHIDNEAKQKFLQSGVPEQIKKKAAQQKSKEVFVNYFPAVVHVQQSSCEKLANGSYFIENLCLSDPDDPECDHVITIDGFFKKLLNNYNLFKTKKEPKEYKNIKALLQNMKTLKPNFPIYRTYRLLRDKKKGELKDNSFLNLDNSIEILNGMIDITNENPDQLSWTDKYRATACNQILGNYETTKELKKWLISWKENQLKSKQRLNSDSDSSDFYNSDTDSRDTLKNGNNLVILTGPIGSGKTSSVYAVAAELAIKVIEVNVSTKRTGKIMLQDLQEATQSHKVNRTASNSENSQKSQENINLNEPKKRGRKPKKKKDKIQKCVNKTQSLSLSQNSQEAARTDSSLILIDDADIVFDQDDGFCSAIVQIVQSSKRPVILVTSSLSCPHLNRFIQSGKILKFKQLTPRFLGPWLDVMCLVENGTCCPGTGAKFLDYFKGDIRKTINFLQFHTISEANTVVTDSHIMNLKSQIDIDDEKSSMSWADCDEIEVNKIKIFASVNKNSLWYEFQNRLLLANDSILNIWWSIPEILNIEKKDEIIEDTTKKDCSGKLELMVSAVDSISMADYFCSKRKNIIDGISKPWYSNEFHSVLEQENVEEYNNSAENTWEMSQDLIKISLARARNGCNEDSNYEINVAGMSIQRERDVVVSRHNNLNTCINPSAVLDRKSVALDYWSSCRRICSIEKTKTDSNSKRNNRFCHYLKSVNVQCRSDIFENLGDSLNFHKTFK